MAETAADILVVGAIVLGFMRASGRYGMVCIGTSLFYIGFLFGLGLGMFRRNDVDCKVYLIAGVVMVGVEVGILLFTRVFPWIKARARGWI